MKTIQEVKESFRKNYNEYAKDLNEFNKLIEKMAKETDEILSFMETTIKLKEEMKVPQPQ